MSEKWDKDIMKEARKLFKTSQQKHNESERKYYLTLRDEDNEPTHICLFEKDDSQKQLELVEKSKYDSLKEKADKLRSVVCLEDHDNYCSYANTRDPECICGTDDYNRKLKRALQEYDQARGEG